MPPIAGSSLESRKTISDILIALSISGVSTYIIRFSFSVRTLHESARCGNIVTNRMQGFIENMKKQCNCTVCEFHSACTQLIDKEKYPEAFGLLESLDMLNEIITTEFGMVVAQCIQFSRGDAKAPYEFTNYSNMEQSHLNSLKAIEGFDEQAATLSIQLDAFTDCFTTLKSIIGMEADFNGKVLEILSADMSDQEKALEISKLADNSTHRKEARSITLKLKEKYNLEVL